MSLAGSKRAQAASPCTHAISDGVIGAMPLTTGVLAPAAQRVMKVSKRFAPTARSDMPLGILEVGTRVSDPAPLSAAAPSSDGVVINHKAPPVYAKEPPRLRAPLIALLGEADEMWPSERYLSGWAQVADGGFRGVTIRNTPHHELQSHLAMQAEVHAECAEALLASVEGSSTMAPGGSVVD